MAQTCLLRPKKNIKCFHRPNKVGRSSDHGGVICQSVQVGRPGPVDVRGGRPEASRDFVALFVLDPAYPPLRPARQAAEIRCVCMARARVRMCVCGREVFAEVLEVAFGGFFVRFLWMVQAPVEGSADKLWTCLFKKTSRAFVCLGLGSVITCQTKLECVSSTYTSYTNVETGNSKQLCLAKQLQSAKCR